MVRPDPNYTPGPSGGGRGGRPKLGPKGTSKGKPRAAGADASATVADEFMQWAKKPEEHHHLYGRKIPLPATSRTWKKWLEEFRTVTLEGKSGLDFARGSAKYNRLIIVEDFIKSKLNLQGPSVTPDQFKQVVGASPEEFFATLAASTKTVEPSPENIQTMGGGTGNRMTMQELIKAANESENPALTPEQLKQRQAAKEAAGLKKFNEATAPSAAEKNNFRNPPGGMDVEHAKEILKRNGYDGLAITSLQSLGGDSAVIWKAFNIKKQLRGEVPSGTTPAGATPTGATPDTSEARIRENINQNATPSSAEVDNLQVTDGAIQKEANRLEGVGEERTDLDFGDRGSNEIEAREDLEAQAAATKLQLEKVQKKPDGLGGEASVNQGSTLAAGQPVSWYAKPFDFYETPSASQSLYPQITKAIKAGMTNDQARLALRKLANESGPALQGEINNYLKRFKNEAAKSGTLSQVQLDSFDSDAVALSQAVTQSPNMPDGSHGTVGTAANTSNLGIVKRLQSQSAPRAPEADSTARLRSTDAISVVELPTRAHGKMVKEGAQTHMPFITKVIAKADGKLGNIPLRGTLHQMPDSFLFKHVDETGQVLGYYEVPTTEGMSRPVDISKEKFIEKIAIARGNPEYDLPPQPVSTETDYDGIKNLNESLNRMKSSSPSVVIGEKPELPVGEQPTLANDAPSDRYGNPFNPNATPDLIRKILEIPGSMRQSENILTRGAGGAIENLIGRLGGKRIREAASNQVVPGTPDAPLPIESRIAMSRPLNNERINQVLGTLNNEGVTLDSLSAEDYGVLYQAFRTDPDGLYNALQGAANRGEDANAAVIARLAATETDLYKKKDLLRQVAAMQSSSQTNSSQIAELLYDTDGTPRRNVKRFASLVDNAMSIGNRPENFETFMALEAMLEADPRYATNKSYADMFKRIESNDLNNIKAEEANKNLVSSSRLAGDTRNFQEVFEGDGLFMYGPASKSQKQDAAFSQKLEVARDLSRQLRLAELEVEKITGRFRKKGDDGILTIKAQNDPQLAKALKIRNDLWEQVRAASKDIGRLRPSQSANEAFTGYVTGQLGNEQPQGGRVQRKPLEDSDNPEYEAPDSGPELSIDGGSSGYGAFSDGFLSMMTRQDPEIAKNKIAAALSGNREVLKQFKVKSVAEFRNQFARVYIRSPLSRMGGEVVTPGNGFDEGSTARQGGVLFPSVQGMDVEEVIRLMDVQNSLRDSLKAELQILKQEGFGRGDMARDKGYGLFGREGLSFKQRKKNSFLRVEKLRNELATVNAKLDQQPQLTAVLDKTNGMLDEIASNRQVSVAETRALERRLEMGNFQNPAQPFNEVRLGQLMGINPILSRPDVPSLSLDQRIAGLKQFLDPRPEVQLPDNSAVDLTNFLENQKLGELPASRKEILGFPAEKGVLPTSDESSVQGARLQFTEDELRVLREVQQPDVQLTPDDKQAVLAKLLEQTKWTDLTIQQRLLNDPVTSGAFQDKLANLPPSHVSRGSLDGSDSDELIPNPDFTRRWTERAETPEQQAKILDMIEPILNYKTQLLNITKQVQGKPTRMEIGQAGSDAVKFKNASDFDKVPVAQNLGQFRGDPRLAPGIAPSMIRPINFQEDGIKSFFAPSGSPEEGGLNIFTREAAANGTSFSEGTTLSAGDQQVELIQGLQKAGKHIGYDFGDISHLKTVSPEDLVFALENMKSGITKNIRTIDNDLNPNLVDNVEESRKAINVIDQAVESVKQISEVPGKEQAAFYDMPTFPREGFVIAEGGGKPDRAYMRSSFPNTGVNQFGPTNTRGQDAYFPIILDNPATSGKDTLPDGITPRFKEYSIQPDGTFAVPKIDLTEINNVAKVEAMVDGGDGKTLADLTPEQRVARATTKTGDEAAAKRASQPNPEQQTYITENIADDVPATKPAVTPEVEATEPMTRIGKLKEELTLGKTGKRAVLGLGMGLAGVGISERIRHQQEREAARNNRTPLPEFSSQKTAEEELIERLQGRQKMKSMTTQVPVMGSGVR